MLAYDNIVLCTDQATFIYYAAGKKCLGPKETLLLNNSDAIFLDIEA